MSKKDRIFIEIIVGLLLITGAVYFFIKPRRESVWLSGRADVDSGKRVVMGTFARVIGVAADSDTAKRSIEAALAEITRVDELMSDYKEDSEISEVNRDGFERAVKVSEPTYEVLQKAVEFSELTGGAFDVTVGALVDLWRSAEEMNSVPSDAELAEARSRVGYDKLILDSNEMTVRFAAEGMRLDLGGIAKGYAIDRAVEAMQTEGAMGGMIDIGGDIRCFGAPPEGKERWRIGLQDSRAVGGEVGQGQILMVLELTDAAVATSGDYQRFVVIGGQRYSHIIDAESGYSGGELTSVTIIAKGAIEADALATAVSVKGVEGGLALVEQRKEAEAILVTSAPEYELIKSSGAERFIE
ncbi:MAG: FAD:protein FMN transferase [Planctomycetota bacterium]|nr:MAG: FAD:protein FMN transferase [Planctomycetota bacterium]